MKIIAAMAAVLMLLAQFSGAIPNASVGGPMTIFFILFIAMLVVGIYEAVLNKRSPFGWIANIVIAVIGGLVASMVGSMAMELLIPLVGLFVRIEGSLMATRHPLLYVLMVGMTLVTVYGSWFALQAVNRYRDRAAAT